MFHFMPDRNNLVEQPSPREVQQEGNSASRTGDKSVNGERTGILIPDAALMERLQGETDILPS